MATWPSTLPQQLEQEGFNDVFPEGAIRTEMASGNPYQRTRYTAAIEPFSGMLYLDAAQYQTLKDFWITTLGLGALSFDWVHPITGAAATVQFIATKPPKITGTKGTLFAVQVMIEVLP